MDVSVIIPVYNKKNTVEKAVYSALDCRETKEVILVDDGSTDGSFKICYSLREDYEEIKLFTHRDRKNFGVSKSRNLGIARASYKFIAFLDADDIYLGRRFHGEEELFQNDEVDGLYSEVSIVSGSELEEFEFEKFNEYDSHSMSRTFDPDQLSRALLGYYNNPQDFIHVDGLTVRTEVARLSGGFNENLKVSEDSEWLFRLSCQFKLYSTEKLSPVAIRVIHDSNHLSDAINTQSRVEYYNTILDYVRNYIYKRPLELLIKQSIYNVKMNKENHPYISIARIKYWVLKIVLSLFRILGL